MSIFLILPIAFKCKAIPGFRASADILPIAVKQVKGHEYMYFSYYDRDEKTKREVYMGPKNSLITIRKALLYNKEYLDLQQSQIDLKYRRIERYIRSINFDLDGRQEGTHALKNGIVSSRKRSS